MRRSFFSLTALVVASSSLTVADAQNTQAAAAAGADVSAPAGFVLAEGVTFVPSALSEIGYDTNPGQTFSNSKGSGFVRSGAGFNVSSVAPGMVATLGASGSVLNYFENTFFEDAMRYAGSANANVTTLVKSGVTASSGAFVNYDGQSVNRNQSAGGNVELAYQDEIFASVFRGKFQGVQYLDTGLIASPISLTRAFNYNRAEGSWTGLVGMNQPYVPYLETAAARVEYTDQPTPAVLNRSADDYRIKSGVRINFTPELQTDVGWRFNWRHTDDHRVTSYDSNYFDGAFKWQPSPVFALSGNIERYIGEPSTNLAILSDVRSYTIKAAYVPVPGVIVTASGGVQLVNEIGNGIRYTAPVADVQVAWDYNSHVQFYTALHYQNYQLTWQNLDYNDLRVMTGVRVTPDGEDLLQGESLESLFTRLADSRLPSGAVLTVSGGRSWFDMPDMKMLTVVGGPFFDKAVGQGTTGAGGMGGWRMDAGLGNFASAALASGYTLSFGANGFYANYQNGTRANCMYGATTDCAFVNIVDFDLDQSNNTGPFGDLSSHADRNVNYYGVAVDMRLGAWHGGGAKDSPAVVEPWPVKFGVSLRGIDEAAKLNAHDPLVSAPVNYNEKVNAQYYGGFVGYERKYPLSEGWVFGVDAAAGLYYAASQYQGWYTGYSPVAALYLQDCGSATDSLNHGSFIGTLKVSLNHDLGWGTAGIFGQGEYLSYAPRIAYNNNDQADFLSGWPVSGNQAGTRIKADDAFNYTTGLSLSVRAN